MTWDDDYSVKNYTFGAGTLTIHVWHSDHGKRGTVSAMLRDIKQTCRSLTVTRNYSWDVRSLQERIFPDVTTTTPILHGVLEITFTLQGGSPNG